MDNGLEDGASPGNGDQHHHQGTKSPVGEALDAVPYESDETPSVSGLRSDMTNKKRKSTDSRRSVVIGSGNSECDRVSSTEPIGNKACDA